MFRVLIPAILALGLGACVHTPPRVSSQAVTVVPNTELPPPSGADLSAQERPYLIGPFDKLRIDVFGIAELSDREIQVDASGRASFPLAGLVPGCGLTPTQLAEELQRRLAGSYIRNPQVTVNLQETVSQVVTVDGQVARPGLYPVVGRMTLMQAVATAGGSGDSPGWMTWWCSGPSTARIMSRCTI